MATVEVTELDTDHLEQAQQGSYYTIIGAGGELTDWVNGYTEMLEADGIGTPQAWFKTSGACVNGLGTRSKGYRIHEADRFPSDLTFLMFKLDGLNMGKLALFKLVDEARWFDDIILNMRPADI